MSEEILEEIVKTETPAVEITNFEGLFTQRENPLCVISKATFGEYAMHDIQTNSAWSENPYEDYAIVPDEMVADILETRGFCDITLSEDGTEVVSFTANEIPEIPNAPHKPTAEERIAELEAQNEMLMSCVLEMSEIVYA